MSRRAGLDEVCGTPSGRHGPSSNLAGQGAFRGTGKVAKYEGADSGAPVSTSPELLPGCGGGGAGACSLDAFELRDSRLPGGSPKDLPGAPRGSRARSRVCAVGTAAAAARRGSKLGWGAAVGRVSAARCPTLLRLAP